MNLDSYEYSIEALIAIFSEHARKYREQEDFSNRQWLNHFVGQELPDHMVNSFNLSQALCVICCEIQELKERLEKHLDFPKKNSL